MGSISRTFSVTLGSRAFGSGRWQLTVMCSCSHLGMAAILESDFHRMATSFTSDTLPTILMIRARLLEYLSWAPETRLRAWTFNMVSHPFHTTENGLPSFIMIGQ